MAHLIKYSLWCETCVATRYTEYIPEEEGQPTVCPYNAAHTNIRDISIIESVSTDPLPVKQIDVDNLDPDKSRSKSKGINFDAAAGAWTKDPLSFPYYVNVLNGQGYGGFCEDGDKVEFSVDPQFFGVVAQAVAQGGTEIYVSPGVPETVLPGMWLQFERGGNPGAPTSPDSEHPGDDEYEIAYIDYETGKVTLRTGIDLALSQYDLVYVVSKYGEDIELQTNELIDIGGSSSGSAPLPPNMVFNVWFYNAGQASKRVRFRLNFKYGPLAEE